MEGTKKAAPAGAGAAVALARFLHPALPEEAERIVVPRDEG